MGHFFSMKKTEPLPPPPPAFENRLFAAVFSPNLRGGGSFKDLGISLCSKVQLLRMYILVYVSNLVPYSVSNLLLNYVVVNPPPPLQNLFYFISFSLFIDFSLPSLSPSPSTSAGFCIVICMYVCMYCTVQYCMYMYVHTHKLL